MIPERGWNMDLEERSVEFEIKEIVADEPTEDGGYYVQFIDQDGKVQEVACNAEERRKVVDDLAKIEVTVCEAVANIRLKPKDL